MNFDEVRAKYPEYGDLDDDQLAQGLHKKFYSDMPFEDFAGKVGYAPAGPGLIDTITGFLGDAVMRAPTPTDVVRSAYDAASGFFGDMNEAVSVTQKYPQTEQLFPRLTGSSPAPAVLNNDQRSSVIGPRIDPMLDNPILREVLAKPVPVSPSGTIAPDVTQYKQGSAAQNILDIMSGYAEQEANRETTYGPGGKAFVPGLLAGGAVSMAGNLADFGHQVAGTEPGPLSDVTGQFSRAMMQNNPGLVDEVFTSIGSSLPFFGGGVAAARTLANLAKASPSLANWVGASVFGVGEAAPESGSVYKELISAGVDPDTAKAASNSKFLVDLGANITLNRAGLFSGKGPLAVFGREMVTEQGEEQVQNMTSNTVMGRPTMDNASHVAKVTALATLPMAGAGAVLTPKEGKAAVNADIKNWAKNIEINENIDSILSQFADRAARDQLVPYETNSVSPSAQSGQRQQQVGPSALPIRNEERRAASEEADWLNKLVSIRSGAQPLDEKQAHEFEQQVAAERAATGQQAQKKAQVDAAYADREAQAAREKEMDTILADWEKADQEQEQADLLQQLRDKAGEIGGPMQAAWERVIENAILEREGRIRGRVASQERSQGFSQAEQEAQQQRQQDEDSAYQQAGRDRVSGGLTRAKTERNITGQQPTAMENAFSSALLSEPKRLITNQERHDIREEGGAVSNDYAYSEPDIAWRNRTNNPDLRAYDQVSAASNVLSYASDPLTMAVHQANREAEDVNDIPEISQNLMSAVERAKADMRTGKKASHVQEEDGVWSVIGDMNETVATFGADELAARTFDYLRNLEVNNPTPVKTPNLDAMRQDMVRETPWKVSRTEFIGDATGQESSIRGEQHRLEVRRALNRGEQVPQSALEAYLDLQDKAPGGLLAEGAKAQKVTATDKTPKWASRGISYSQTSTPFNAVKQDPYQPYVNVLDGPLFQMAGHSTEIPVPNMEPGFVSAASVGEAGVLSNLMNQLAANGLPLSNYMPYINSIGVLRGTSPETLGVRVTVMEQAGGNGLIALSEHVIYQSYSSKDVAAAMQALFTMAHELGHGIDLGYTASSPLFSATVGSDGFVHLGPVLEELRSAYLNGPSWLRDELSYPFRSVEDIEAAVVQRDLGAKSILITDPDGKVVSVSVDEFIDSRLELIRSEGFAQLHGLFYTVGVSEDGLAMLRDSMPDSISFMEDVHDATSEKSGISHERLSAAFQSGGSVVGNTGSQPRRVDGETRGGNRQQHPDQMGQRSESLSQDRLEVPDGRRQVLSDGLLAEDAREHRKSDVGHKIVKSTGRYVGAPDWIGSSPQKLAHLRKKLRKLAEEGESGRYWYEKSSRAVLDFVGNDKVDAEKFVGLLAIYSQGTEVNVNLGFALEAYYQWKMDLPIKTGRFPETQNEKAETWLRGGEIWDGIKTNNFYADLMEEIDASKVDYEHSTMDMWMAIAFDYGSKVLDQGPKYGFAKREIVALAKEMGWKPHQVQAAIWTAIKGRVESSKKAIDAAEKRLGIDSEDTKSKGTPENWGKGAYAHYRLAHKLGMESGITKEEIAERGFDFSDGLTARVAQMSWEATPSVTGGDIPGIHTAPIEQKFEYLQAVSDVLFKDGVDQIATLIGLHKPPTVFGYSAWEGAVGAGAQSFFPVPITGQRKGRAVLPPGRDAMNLYAAVMGFVLKQDAVVWHVPIYDEAKVRSNGFEITGNRSLTEEETSLLYEEIHEEFDTWGIAPAYTKTGARVLNFEARSAESGERAVAGVPVKWGGIDVVFRDENWNEVPVKDYTRQGDRVSVDAPVPSGSRLVVKLNNAHFAKGMVAVVDRLHDKITDFLGGSTTTKTYRSDGDFISNDWGKYADGQEYSSRISKAGRPDLQRGAERLRADIEAVNRDFADRYGWNKGRSEGTSSFLVGDAKSHQLDAGGVDRSAGRRDEGISSPPVREDGRVELTHWGRTAGLKELDPAFYGKGITGAEKRRKINNPHAWVDRTYYGIAAGQQGGYKREASLGRQRYTVSIEPDRLYDIASDPDSLYQGDPTEHEKAIRDAGYAGYWRAHPSLGMVAAVFEKMPVEKHISETGATLYANPIEPMVEAYQKTVDRVIDTWNDLAGWKYSELGKLPGKDLYLARRYKALGKIAQVEDIAASIYDVFSTASPEDQVAVYQYLTDKAGTPHMIADPVVKRKAVATKKMFIRVGQQLVDMGLLPAEVFEENKGGYLPRLYLRHLLPNDVRMALGSGKKVSDQGYLKKRLKEEQLSKETREIILGEVTDPAFLAAQGLTVQMRDIAILRLLEDISQNSDWVWDDTVIDWEGKLVSIFWLDNEANQIERQAAHYQDGPRQKALQLVERMRKVIQPRMEELGKAPPDYKKVPNTPRYGRLRGMYLRKEIYNDLIDSGQMVAPDADVWSKLFGYGSTGTKIMQLWKMSKVALNPPAQIRNVMSNMILLHLSGMPLYKVPYYIGRALEHRMNNGKYWRIAKKLGVTESTFSSQELVRIHRDLLNLQTRLNGKWSLAHVRELASVVAGGASDAYQFFEELGKTARIMYGMEEEGRSESDAGMEAQRWLFDYSLVPRTVRTMRNSPVGMPFATFYYKVLPRMLEAAVKRPLSFAPYIALPYVFVELFASLYDVDDDDMEKLQKAFPTWIREKGHALLLPYKDDRGRWQIYDFSYLLPWTMFSETAKNTKDGNLADLIDDSGMFGGPITSIIAVLIDDNHEDPWSGRKVWNPADPAKKQAQDMLLFLWNLSMPTWITENGVAGKMLETIEDKVDPKTGRHPLTVTQSALRAIGANVYPFEPEKDRNQNLARMKYDINDTKRAMRDALKNADADEVDGIVEMYSEMLKEQAAEIGKYSEESYLPERLR